MRQKKAQPKKKRSSAPRTARDRAIKLGTKEVPNPHFNPAHVGASANPKKVVATVNVRESAVATMASRALLDEAQVEAADQFRRLFETLGGSGAGAMDYSKEPVDGGGAVEPISDSQVSAGLELARVREHLGARGYDLVSKVCGEGKALIEVSPVRRGRDTAADNLRDHLDDLATMWGLARQRGAGWSRKSRPAPGSARLGKMRSDIAPGARPKHDPAALEVVNNQRTLRESSARRG